MRKYIIEGGRRIEGELSAHGSKNAALPILAASMLTRGTVLYNCPNLSDVNAACAILTHLGCNVRRGQNQVEVLPTNSDSHDIPDNLMREMRSSIVFLGAIIARHGKARVSLPGGCDALRRIIAKIGGAVLSCTTPPSAL